MPLSELANEILLHIFSSCNSVHDALALASTSRHMHSLLNSSHRLPILYQAAEAQFGPLHDVTRLVTYNVSQPPTIPRPAPPRSFALLKRLLEVGRTANAWAEIYPQQKWRGGDSSSRRFLTSMERYNLRRACYRIWLYNLAFHSPFYPRATRLSPPIVRQRAALLRPWPARELAEMLDLHSILRQVLHSYICPSNGTVIRRHRARYPDDPFPMVAVTSPGRYAREHGAYHHSSVQFHSTPHTTNYLYSAPTRNHRCGYKENYGIAVEGWGDEISHYYVIEDMLKLDPSQLLYLYTRILETKAGPVFNPGVSAKGLVESYVAGLAGGEWFENNGETFAETVGFVEGERGGELGDLKGLVEDGVEGIARV